jgi:hypothetical protein
VELDATGRSEVAVKISDNKLRSVCLIGQGDKTCAFLGCGANGFECLKGTGAERFIRQRLANGTIGARGDNCEGNKNEVG